MLGIDFTCDSIRIRPCLPKEFADSSAMVHYNGHRIDFRYHGYGSEVVSIELDGIKVDSIRKNALSKDCVVDVFLK